MPNRNLRFLVLFLPLLTFFISTNAQTDFKLEKGFKKIFNGKNLNGWEGDSLYWRVEDGSIVGEITADKLLKRNTFLIYRNQAPSDFELIGEFKITAKGNSGINYRSEELLPDLPFAMRGYQADIDGANQYTGQNYEERGRSTLAYRGEVSTITEQNPTATRESLRSFSKGNNWTARVVTEKLADAETLKSKIKSDDWNEIHIIAKGNRLQHYVNGTLMCDVTDMDVVNGRTSGYIGVQVHVGPPMKVAYRNIRIKNLK